jgi:hypothetical protein
MEKCKNGKMKIKMCVMPNTPTLPASPAGGHHSNIPVLISSKL